MAAVGDLLTRARRLPAGKVLVVLLIAHVVLKVALFPRALNAPLIGDEAQYVDGAKALANMLRDLGGLRSPDSGELSRSLVGSGWFMPGMSVVMAPLFLLVPHAGLGLLRAYLGVFSTLLLLVAVRSARRTFGDKAAIALMVFPGLVPMWLLFSYASWGDLPAGLVVVMLVAETVRLFRGYLQGEAPQWRAGVRFGLLGIITLYLRSSTKPLLIGLLVLAVLGLVVFLRGRDRGRALLAAAAGTAVFIAVLVPWSVAASLTLDSKVITTTTVSTSLANTFGDRDRICYGPCDPGSTIWFSPLRYARETARATGRGEAEVLEQMSTYSRADVTPASYSGDVLADFGRYTLKAPGYEDWFRPGTVHLDPGRRDAVSILVVAGTSLLYYPALLIGAGFMFIAVRRRRDLQLQVIVLKLVGAALMLQPFVHLCTSRYWPTFGPVFALAAALLVGIWWGRGDHGPRPPTWLDRALYRIQVALGIGFAAVLAGLSLVATLG